MPEYEVDHPYNSDSDVSTHSLNSEFGTPIMQIPSVKKALTLSTEELRRSSREKNYATRFGYNEYMVHHFAFRMKATAE